MPITKIREKQLNELRLGTAFNKFQQLKVTAKKDGTNPHFKSNYSTLESVIDAVNHGSEFGLFFTQHIHEHEGKLFVKTVMRHVNDTDTYESCVPVPCANLQNPHQMGSGITYAKRYGLQSLYGLPSEDDDGNGTGTTGKKDINPKAPQVNEQVNNIL